MTKLTVHRGREAEPFADLERLFGDTFPGWFGATVPGLPIDVSETEDAYLVEVDAPGLGRDDFELTLERNRLTIGVNATAEGEQSERRYLRRERTRMHASRTVRFPHAIDADGVAATFDNGVLTITAPKSAADRARKIDIS